MTEDEKFKKKCLELLVADLEKLFANRGVPECIHLSQEISEFIQFRGSVEDLSSEDRVDYLRPIAQAYSLLETARA